MKGSVLKARLKNEGINLHELAMKLGYATDQNLHSVLGAADVKSSLMENISRILGRPIGWFYDDVQEEPTPPFHGKRLPLIPFDAVAGPGTPVFEDSRVEEYYYVSEFKECDFLIRVKGDSMAPHFTGGDLLACRKVVDAFFFQWGRCYVVYTRSQGVMVKRVQPSEKEGYITCVSDNPKYAPFDVPLEDVVSVALVNGSISLE